MRLIFLLVVLIALVALAAGQEASRRERLRSLIAAARGGDREARNTLRNLRNKLRNRANNKQSEPVPEPRHFDVQPVQEQIVQEQPQPQLQQQPQPEQQVQEFVPAPRRPQVQRQPFRSSIQERKQTFQFDPNSSVSDVHEPHRALNRGLEVDTRSEANAVIRVTNKTNTPPIETIKRYSYFDEEGNYIFGYEAADGSFKEEKRGLDCIVHGKYGYVDPDGIRREFTYVSGNQCDPNAPANPEGQNNVPSNDQFLVQTQEKKADKVHTFKPKPTPQRAPVQNQFKPKPTPQRAPVQNQFKPQPTPQRAPIQNQRPQKVNIRRQKTRVESIQQQPQITLQQSTPKKVPQESTFQQPRPKPVQEIKPEVTQEVEITPPKPVAQKKAEKEHRRPIDHFSPAQFNQPSKPIFRPTPKPLDFNFEQEFKQLFSNFANDRPRQVIRQRTQKPLPPPPPPPTPKPTPAPPKPAKKVVPKEPAPRLPQSKSPSVPHQLVFDSATGTFKTVSLGNQFQPTPVVKRPQPPPLAPKPLPVAPKSPPPPPPQTFHSLAPKAPQVGKPLPLAGFNPLPPVPIGSLTFQNGGSGNAAAHFDNFFRQFNI